MSALDMHRSPKFFVLCLCAAFLAGLVTGEDRAIEAEIEAAAPVAAAPVMACPPPDTRNWVAKGFDGVPPPAKVAP